MSIVASQAVSKKRYVLFLNYLEETGRVDHAAALAGFTNTSVVYKKRKDDPDFAAKWAEALDRAGDGFEAEAARRGREGVLKDVYYKGEVVGQERVYSDGLLSKLLEGAKPDKYNKRINEHKGEVNVNVGLAVIPMIAPQIEDWERASLDMHQNIIDTTAQEVARQIEGPIASRPMKVVRA